MRFAVRPYLYHTQTTTMNYLECTDSPREEKVEISGGHHPIDGVLSLTPVVNLSLMG